MTDCANGTRRCKGNQIETCYNGSWTLSIACNNEICTNDSQGNPFCKPAEPQETCQSKCADGILSLCQPDGSSSLENCANKNMICGILDDGTPACVDKTQSCQSICKDGILSICHDDGSVSMQNCANKDMICGILNDGTLTCVDKSPDPTDCKWNGGIVAKDQTICDGNLLKTCSSVVNTQFDAGRDCIDIDPAKPICDVNVCRKEKSCGSATDIEPNSIVCNDAGTNKAKCIDGKLVDLISKDACTARENASPICTFTTEATCSDACNTGFVDIKGTCERIKQCDTSKEIYNASTNTCECNADAQYVGEAGSCQCNTGYFAHLGQCIAGCRYNDSYFKYGESTCNSKGELVTCHPDGSMLAAPCETGVCIGGACVVRDCGDLKDGETRCSDGSLMICSDGTLKSAPTPCTEKQLCLDGENACVNKVTCTATGSNLDTATNTCVCDSANHWNGSAGSCTCDTGYVQIDSKCELKKTCDETKEIYNSDTNTCLCDIDNHWNGLAGSCECEPGFVLLDKTCVPKTNCKSNETYNETTNSCSCDAPYVVANGNCEVQASCETDETYDVATNTCSINYENKVVGDTLVFGNYNGTPIKWYIMEKDKYHRRFKLVSVDVLDRKPYHNTEYNKVSWGSSSIRDWLNGYGLTYATDNFISNAFTSEEQSRILELPVYEDLVRLERIHRYNPVTGTDEDTYDVEYVDSHGDPFLAPTSQPAKVFLLSTYEAKQLGSGDNACTNMCSKINCNNNSWLLRSIHGDYNSNQKITVYGNSGYKCATYSDSFPNTFSAPIRPAIWLSY